MPDTPEIQEREDGPLVVTGVTSMTDADGNAVEVKPVMALCRCGQSKSKPFCDGSHRDAGFKSRGGEPSGKNREYTFKGSASGVVYNPMVCSHAAFCVTNAGHMFNLENKPWVDPDKGTDDELRAIVMACPSGALQMATEAGGEHLIDETRAQITIQKDGPYYVTGITPPEDQNGSGMTPRKYVLCRCGKSGNKPFCDGAHRDAGWRDDA